MNIHVGDEIELTEEVVPENTAEKWGSGSLPVYASWWNDQMSLFLNRDRPQTSGIPCRSN